MLNKILLIGNLTKDPEGPKPAGSGTVTNFRIAVNERFGEGRERTLFIDVECWARTAEVVAQFTRKGSRVFIEGRLQLDEWGEGEERRSKYKVVANTVRFVDSRSGEDDGGGGGGTGGGDYGGGEHEPYRPSSAGAASPGSPYGGDSGGGGGGGQVSEGTQPKSSLPDYGLDDDIPF